MYQTYERQDTPNPTGSSLREDSQKIVKAIFGPVAIAKTVMLPSQCE